MSKPFDVLVTGGGITGLSAALAMAGRGFHVAIIDSGSFSVRETPEASRVYAINQASQTFFQKIGVWDLIGSDRISPYHHMSVWENNGGSRIEFDARLIAKPSLGVIVEESVLKRALLEKVALTKNVECFPDSPVTSLNSMENAVRVHSRDCVWEGRLLMVAEGGDSISRQLLKIPVTTWPYHQHAIVATVKTEKPHQKTARQIFHQEGPLAFLPLTDGHHSSIVWSTSPSRSKRLMTLPEPEFNQELAAAFEHCLGKVSLLGRRNQFPLTMRHVKQYAGANWLVLGDAAHTIHPMAGLGLNVGLADITTWLSCLDNASGSFPPRKALAAYGRQRKHAVWQVIALMSGLKWIFSNPLPPVRTVRNWGLNVCNQMGPLKRLLITHASG